MELYGLKGKSLMTCTNGEQKRFLLPVYKVDAFFLDI